MLTLAFKEAIFPSRSQMMQPVFIFPGNSEI